MNRTDDGTKVSIFFDFAWFLCGLQCRWIHYYVVCWSDLSDFLLIESHSPHWNGCFDLAIAFDTIIIDSVDIRITHYTVSLCEIADMFVYGMLFFLSCPSKSTLFACQTRIAKSTVSLKKAEAKRKIKFRKIKTLNGYKSISTKIQFTFAFQIEWMKFNCKNMQFQTFSHLMRSNSLNALTTKLLISIYNSFIHLEFHDFFKIVPELRVRGADTPINAFSSASMQPHSCQLLPIHEAKCTINKVLKWKIIPPFNITTLKPANNKITTHRSCIILLIDFQNHYFSNMFRKWGKRERERDR